jgi:hypothetical protein
MCEWAGGLQAVPCLLASYQVFLFTGPLLVGRATVPSLCIPGTRGRGFPEDSSRVRCVTGCFALGQFYLKRAGTLYIQGHQVLEGGCPVASPG